MIRICKEENFHRKQGIEIITTLANGTPEQKAMAQSAVNRWWWPTLMMFGPRDNDSPNSNELMQWKIKTKSNDELRQRFVDNTVPDLIALGLNIPDPDLEFDEKTGKWQFGEIDWDEFYSVIKGHGPCNHERLQARRNAKESGQWVRDAAKAFAEKHV